jgi:phosphoribosyl-AMP cyclohydrolase
VAEIMDTSWLSEVHWTEEGLVPAIAQDYKSKRILMVAWMNHEALELTVREQRAIYWSRSRRKLWRKGEESGHVQKLHGIFLDCDADAIILEVEQIGGIACHTGRESCFFRELVNESDKTSNVNEKKIWRIVEPVKKDPKDIYKK